jgi:RNA polymerase sporulation-specific sigma factor
MIRLTEDRHHLVTENIGLVAKFAGKMAMANRDPALDYEDFFSAGCFGLMYAAAGFDPTKGFAFSTFATRSIIGQIKRHKNINSAIYVPVNVKQIAASMSKQGLEGASAEEVSEKLGVPLTWAENAKEYAKWLVLSADSPSQVDEDSSYQDLFAAPPIDLTEPYVEEFISTLKPREQKIVQGLLDTKTLREIGEELGVSYQRIGAQVNEIREKWLNHEHKVMTW